MDGFKNAFSHSYFHFLSRSKDFSRNGTFVNEEKLGFGKKRILRHGDMISIAYPKMQAFFFRDHRRLNNDLPEEMAKKYYLGKKLGAGACGTVFLVYDYRTCGTFALKHIKKNQLMDYKADKSLNEASIMKSLIHPCIVKMHDIYDCTDSVYITLELMKGGELLTRIQKKRFLSENNSKVFFYQMCHAIKYLHGRNITHRDLKPDNILLASSDENTLLKISDFGMSKLVKNNSVLRTLCGTPLYVYILLRLFYIFHEICLCRVFHFVCLVCLYSRYVAPEVLLTNGKGEYTEKVDIWSLGVVLFTMLSGTLPFADDYGTAAAEQIKRGKFEFRSSNWRSVSSTARDLIRELLTTDVTKRPSIDQLLKHKWLRDRNMIVTAYKVMGIPLEKSQEFSIPWRSGKDDGFTRPYEVDVDSENVQSSKRRRLR